MKEHLTKFPILAVLAFFIQTSGHAQDTNRDENTIRRDDIRKEDNSARREDEIVIRHRGGKDAKVTIEIKDGDVLVNGKPASEYEDSTLTIHRRKINRYGNTFTFSSPEIIPDVNVAPFEGRGFGEGNGNGSWSYSGDNLFKSNRAILGVATERNGNGKGDKITQVTKGSTAEKMGLQLGDVITKVGDEEVGESQSLHDVIGGHDPGEKITITYLRNGKEQKATGELGKAKNETVRMYNFRMPEMPEMKALPRGNWPDEFNTYFGNSLKFGIRAQDAEDGKGVKVLEVDDESVASKAGIKEGDIITRFDGKETNSVNALTDAAHAAKEKVSVKVSIVRDGKAQELDVKVPRRLRTADL